MHKTCKIVLPVSTKLIFHYVNLKSPKTRISIKLRNQNNFVHSQNSSQINPRNVPLTMRSPSTKRKQIIETCSSFAIRCLINDQSISPTTLVYNKSNIIEYSWGCLYTTRYMISQISFWVSADISNLDRPLLGGVPIGYLLSNSPERCGGYLRCNNLKNLPSLFPWYVKRWLV